LLRRAGDPGQSQQIRVRGLDQQRAKGVGIVDRTANDTRDDASASPRRDALLSY
jgi:hypothetical protein